MVRPTAVAVSPNGRLVFTSGIHKGASLSVFKRTRGAKLRLVRTIRAPRRLSLTGIGQVRFSENGRALYAVARGRQDRRFLLRFKATPKSGRITFAQCVTSVAMTPCDQVPELEGLSQIATVGGSIYATAARSSSDSGADALVRFRLQPSA